MTSSRLQLDAALAASRQVKRNRELKHPKLVQRLQSALIDAWDLAATHSDREALSVLSASGVRLRQEKVIVIVECAQTSAPKDVAAAIAARDGVVVRSGESHVKAAVPIPALADIATMPGVSFVRTPVLARAMNPLQTEGLTPSNAADWHAAGFRGQGVKVAVIDSSFAELAAWKAAGEIPASAIEVDFSGEGMTSGTDSHGVACAEIIYDMAPGCQLYLLKAKDNSDHEEAKNYCKAQGMNIISHSGGYDAMNFHDGVAYGSITPHPIAIMEDAVAAGILWVNAAGNEARQHARISWRDADGDDLLDWDSRKSVENRLWVGVEPIPAGTEIQAFLTWNDWPVTNQDFDLFLVRLTPPTGVVAQNTDAQTGTQPPREALEFTVDIAGDYALVIARVQAAHSPAFILRTYPTELFYFDYDEFKNPVPGSICIPADGAKSLAVGAIDVARFLDGPIETFSSLGPNNGAYTGHPTVVKPDICGPDRVTTATTGVRGFSGTSAAAPHIAGLAALVRSAYPAYDMARVRSYLESHGVELGSQGKDNTYGYGPCVLPTPPSATPSMSLSVTDDLIVEGGGVATVTASLAAVSPLPVTVILGFSGTAAKQSDYRTSDGSILIPAGNLSGSITLSAVADSAPECSETIVVTLLPGSGYTVGTPNIAVVTIAESDQPVGVVYVDGSQSNAFPSGSICAPFSTVVDAYNAARNGYVICIFGTNYNEAITMSKPLLLQGTNGVVNIGIP